MALTFELVWPKLARDGDHHGDIQVSDGWSKRWRTTEKTPDGYWLVFTANAAVTRSDQGEGPEQLSIVTEFLACTDWRHPGDTEVWSDNVYVDGYEGYPITDDGSKELLDDMNVPATWEWPDAIGDYIGEA